MGARALWSAATGMMSQQLNVDIISNNLANVNTTGYKKKRAEFKDMLYETMDKAYLLQDKGKPSNLQVGHGVSVIATSTNYETGTFEKTESSFDFAIDGEGFFKVMGPTEETVFTKDGSFRLMALEDGTRILTTAEGYPVLDDSDQQIAFNSNIVKIIVSEDGETSGTDENGEVSSLDIKIGLVKFENKQGLENIGKNLYKKTSSSGEPIPDDEIGIKSIINQGFLESSNVQVVEEMVKLIVAQRAYEISSKAIQSADQMLEMANNLRR